MRELIPEEDYMAFTNWNVTDEELVGMSDDKNMTMHNGMPVNDDEVISESLVTSKDVFEARREGNLGTTRSGSMGYSCLCVVLD